MPGIANVSQRDRSAPLIVPAPIVSTSSKNVISPKGTRYRLRKRAAVAVPKVSASKIIVTASRREKHAPLNAGARIVSTICDPHPLHLLFIIHELLHHHSLSITIVIYYFCLAVLRGKKGLTRISNLKIGAKTCICIIIFIPYGQYSRHCLDGPSINRLLHLSISLQKHFISKRCCPSLRSTRTVHLFEKVKNDI